MAPGDDNRLYVHWAPARPEALLDPAAWRQGVFPALTGVTRWMYAEPLQVDGRHGLDLIVGGKLARNARRSVLGWTARNLSGPIGIKFDLVRLVDLDGDGDLDVLTTEEQEDSRGLGVIWYENPTGQGR